MRCSVNIEIHVLKIIEIFQILVVKYYKSKYSGLIFINEYKYNVHEYED